MPAFVCSFSFFTLQGCSLKGLKSLTIHGVIPLIQNWDWSSLNSLNFLEMSFSDLERESKDLLSSHDGQLKLEK